MIRIIFVFAASASFQINPFGSCIFVSCSSPVTGFIKLSTYTSMISETEKLLFFPSTLKLISTNCLSIHEPCIGYPYHYLMLHYPKIIFLGSPQTTEAISDITFVMLKELPISHYLYMLMDCLDFTTTRNFNFVSEIKYDIKCNTTTIVSY